MENEFILDALIADILGSVDTTEVATTSTGEEIIFSLWGHAHFVDIATLNYVSSLITNTKRYYEEMGWCEEDISEINHRLVIEGQNDFCQTQNAAPKKKKKNRKTSIYIIRDSASSSLKIGKSKNPDNRLRSHQTSNPNKLELVATFSGHDSDEVYLHEALKDAGYHIIGEWFKDCREVIEIVSNHFERIATKQNENGKEGN